MGPVEEISRPGRRQVQTQTQHRMYVSGDGISFVDVSGFTLGNVSVLYAVPRSKNAV